MSMGVQYRLVSGSTTEGADYMARRYGILLWHSRGYHHHDLVSSIAEGFECHRICSFQIFLPVFSFLLSGSSLFFLKLQKRNRA